MRYDSDLLYRPPGEWKSYLLQCTIGCSNNKCTFCGMYKEKKFRIRPTEEILEDIDMAREYYGPNLRRVFLMDGDAIIIKTEESYKSGNDSGNAIISSLASIHFPSVPLLRNSCWLYLASSVQ